MNEIKTQDPKIYQSILNELNRQKTGLVMIASENFTSPAVLATMGTVLNNKYAEGYPQARYYTGNQFIDEIENIAIERAKKLFQADHANVQPHSGTTANLAIYAALLKPGDKILSLNLAHGGHLSHGSKASLVSQIYKIIHYNVNPQTNLLDYEEIKKIAEQEKPQIIVSGFSSYPRQIDFNKLSEIAHGIGAYHLADISHIAGLIIAGEHQNPFPEADVVMTTTHKTLRGPRGAIILCKNDFADKIDKAVFPGVQGGPFEHVIAAKAVCFQEANTDKFKSDQKQTIINAKTLAKTLIDNKIALITGGTDTHLILIDCRPLNTTGKEAANALAKIGIYTNANVIPYDTNPPINPSGLRLGTPALTTQGMKENEMQQIGQTIAELLKNPNNEKVKNIAKELVKKLTTEFPIYKDLKY